MIVAVSTKPDPAADKPTRGTGQPPKVICRYLRQTGAGNLERCTGEAVDPEGEVLLCTTHLARAIQLVQHATADFS